MLVQLTNKKIKYTKDVTSNAYIKQRHRNKDKLSWVIKVLLLQAEKWNSYFFVW